MDTTEKTKGTHGGARAGAGRPRNPNKLTNQKARKTLGQPLLVAPSQRAGGNAGPSSTSRPPDAFFLPCNTNNPVPLGNSAVTPMQTSSRNSFWSAGGLPRSTAAAVGNLSNTGPNNLQASGENPPRTEISVDQFTQLNQELEFIDENDEHADIAAGDRVFDESLVSEVLDYPEAGTATPEAETQSSEAVKTSVLHKQLVLVKDRLCEEIEEHGKPLCYARGDFFDRPPHPVFALEESAASTGLDPNILYWWKVFVWLPHLLPGCPDRFKFKAVLTHTHRWKVQGMGYYSVWLSTAWETFRQYLKLI
ncbi:hypothetical protein B0H11DRAFT_1939665 [Mycena galericulata]|nr:hypothetical protein B0H11DRAFT_1939665 [Mycena galericulata]